MVLSDKKIYFRRHLLLWYKKNKRPHPWKNTNDPYKIWLSEIILQQTRVQQGTPYYLKLIKLFPTVFDLANSKEDKLLKAWEGLGYYSRARNLHHTAKYIVNELSGKFPENFNDLLKLKGVGSYTAAAVASFAFNEVVAVVDGNVLRVLSRYFGATTPVDTTEGKKKFFSLANELIDRKDPGGFNQAIMDFGAMVCKPVAPDCDNCPLNKKCFALKKNKIALLPVKEKKLKMKERFFHFIVVQNTNGFYIEKRNKKDIWKGLYQFPLIERQNFLSLKQLQSTSEWRQLFGKNFFIKNNSGRSSINPEEKIQLLSHQKIHAKFFEVEGEILNDDFNISDKKNLAHYPFPKIIDNYIKNVLH